VSEDRQTGQVAKECPEHVQEGKSAYLYSILSI